MTELLDIKTKKQIAHFLPQAIIQALQSYRNFSGGIATEEAKEFSAHHAACKAALAHIELLLKLARQSDLVGVTDNEKDKNALTDMITKARIELEKYNIETK